MKKAYLLVLTLLAILAIAFWLPYKNSPQQRQREKYEAYLAKEYQKLAKQVEPAVDQPGLAALQDYYATMDPVSKRIPKERLLQAWQTLRSETKSTSDEIEWNIVPSNMGGRTRAIMWDPNDASGKRVFAGSVAGGLWKNDNILDGNSNWENINDFMPSLSISCLTYDPNNTMVFYAGSGEGQTARLIYRESGGLGVGIWKSNDGGTSWELLPSTSGFKYITDIRVRNEDGQSVIYAGVISGYYHGEHPSTPSEGLFRSADGGATWTQVLPNHAGGKPYAPADIEIAANGRIFVGTMKNEDGDGGATILFSDTGLEGSWTVFDDYESIIENDPENNVPGRVVLAAAPSDANRIYALIGAGHIASSTGFNYAYGRNILRSDDNGLTWEEKNMPDAGGNGFATLSWHAFVASVHPANPDMLFIGGLDIWRSTNGGDSWGQLSDWVLMYYGGGPEYVHGDQHCQVFNPQNSDQLLLASDGGIFLTVNAADDPVVFQERNTHYNSLLFYTCDIHPGTGVNQFLGGLQDNGTLLYSGSALNINDMVSGGDGAYCFYDKNSPGVAISTVYFNYIFTYEDNSFYDYNNFQSGVFINPMDYDYKNDILYANACSFSGYNSNKILRIKNIPSLNDTYNVNLNTGLNVYFSSLKVSPHSPPNTTTLYVASQNGRLFRAENAQSVPEVTEIGSPDFPSAYISSIAIGGSEDTLLVTFSNYGVPSVWQTYDGGENWTDISAGLPDIPVRWAIYHPETSKNIMLATELGIWKSVDGSTWTHDATFPNVRVDMLRMREGDNTVLAASHGRGLIYGVWNPVFSATREHPSPAYTVYPNPVKDVLYIEGKKPAKSIKIFTLKGEKVYQEIYQKRLNISTLPAGQYVLEIENDGGITTHKILKL